MTPAINPQEFFDKEREWQWIKHDIFAGYTNTWLTILGSRHKKLHIVDAFAGKGSFPNRDGKDVDGSPVITGKLIAGYNKGREGTGKSCDLLCIEKNKANATALSETMNRFSAFATVRQGSYQDYVSEISAFMGQEPVLLFLDPIGLKAIQAADITPLINRTGKTDVFLTVDFQIVHRTAGMLDGDGNASEEVTVAKANAVNLDRFFGTTEWRGIAGEFRRTRDQESKLLDLFSRNVVGDRYAYKSAYAVRKSATSPPKYWLVHLCDNEKGFLLMNDLIVKIDRQLWELETQGAMALPGMSRDDEVLNSLLQRTREIIASHSHGVSFGAIRGVIQPEFFGRAKQGACSNAVKSLCKAGACSRQATRANAKLDDSEVITPLVAGT